MSLCIGLTGGIGCGKSLVAKLFEERGAGIIDTDTIAHQLTASHGDALPEIQASFGAAYITAGALNRPAMRQLIYADPAAKKQLETLLHPLILLQARTQIGQMKSRYPYLIVVVPLLPVSPEFRSLVNRVLVVDCDTNIRLARVMQRSQMSQAEVCAIMDAQPSRKSYLALADDTIHNDTTPEALAAQVDTLHLSYLTVANRN
jgi:dephospho-CoA kinase